MKKVTNEKCFDTNNLSLKKNSDSTKLETNQGKKSLVRIWLMLSLG
jgi:hypothetical protein